MANPVDDGKIAQHGRELLNRLDAGAYRYYRGMVWSEKLKALVAKGQWHMEVY